MHIQYTLADIKKTFPAVFFERGLAIYEQHKINHVNLDDTDNALVAEVQGSRALPYHQRIFLQMRNSKLIIDGSCDCPIGRNCKHVIAVLIHALHTPPSLIQSSQPATHAQPKPTKPTKAYPALSWLEQINEALAEIDAPDYPPNEAYRLLYVLTPAYYGPGLDVRLMRARLKKDDTFGKAMRYTQFFEVAMGRGGSVASNLDRTLCARILQCNPQSQADPKLSGSHSGEIIRDLISTGRAFWCDSDVPALRLGETRDCSLSWIADDEGNQQLSIPLNEHEQILPIAPPWWINTRNYVCGELQTGLPDAVASILVQSPAIPNELLPEVTATLTHQLPNITLPVPQSLETRQLDNVPPNPVLILNEIPVSLSDHWKRRDDTSTHYLPAAQIAFEYHGIRVNNYAPNHTISQRRDHIRYITDRDTAQEAHFAEQILTHTDLSLVQQIFPAVAVTPEQATAYSLAQPTDWLDFMIEDVPRLRDLGWKIDIQSDFPYRVAEVGEEISAEIEEPSGNDWFSLDLGIDVDGERISLLPILAQTFQQYSPEQIRALTDPNIDPKRKLVCMLPDKRMLALPLKRIQGILTVLVELFDSKTPLTQDGKLELTSLHATRLAELEANARPRWLGGDRLLAMGQKLKNFNGINPVPVPEGLNATLRGYQQEGLNWLQFLREYSLGGILADDMGLGKTLQTLAHLLVEKQSGRADRPSLVIAPTSLMFNWQAEAARFTPDLRVLLLHGLDRKQYFEQINDYDVILTTYPLLARDKEFLTAQPFHFLILDEAHAIKNPKALSTQIVHQIQARHRLALTGTPMENHLGELWSLFHFLLPGLLGSADTFKRQFRTPIEKHEDTQRSVALAQRVKPFMLRRTKAQVVTELPAKTDIIRSCELVGAQRDLYESVRAVMQDKIRREIDAKGFKKSQIVILDALLKLRQVCCDPRLLKLPAARKVHQSAKLEMLTSLLPDMVEEGRRVLLFSQFTSMLDLIEPELNDLKIPFVRLTGDTQDRATPVKQFQNGDVPLFLISLKAGGVGLNLTTADTVIHYDPWWNPAVEDQATGRAHRIGQLNPVFAYKLTTIGTVEEKIIKMQEKKRALAQGILGDAAVGVSAFSPDELISLFEPL
ncbi:DEAD/DEAH box helicase [Sulfuriferula thiophila]|uniref:DEAD/DEAH box helicase n=1 Tax=Sulfuriferula thiophila TaxID=1781211 RepID=UPI000F60EF65|nr:DEAD/DEAH box helicase [Sulfuriferula thiophila]